MRQEYSPASTLEYHSLLRGARAHAPPTVIRKCRMTDTTAPDSSAGLPDFALATLQSGVTQGIFHSLAWYENYLATARPSDVQFALSHRAQCRSVCSAADAAQWRRRTFVAAVAERGAELLQLPVRPDRPAGRPASSCSNSCSAGSAQTAGRHRPASARPATALLRLAARSLALQRLVGRTAISAPATGNCRSMAAATANTSPACRRAEKHAAAQETGTGRTGQLQLEIIADAEQVERLIDAYTGNLQRQLETARALPDFMPG